MTKLAVLVLTCNEANNIEACIQSVSCADEIILVDSGSKDQTCELARSLGARCVHHTMTEEGFAGQRNFALTQTTADWVLYLDADERLTTEANTEIRKLVDNVLEPAEYAIKRVNVVFGKTVHHGAHAPDWCVRLFPREQVHWVGKVHERPETGLQKTKLRGVMHHYTYTNLEAYLRKFNLYTTLAADKLHESGKDASAAKLWLDPVFTFIKMYFMKQGWRDGWLGMVMSVLAAFYVWVKYLKLSLLERGIQHD